MRPAPASVAQACITRLAYIDSEEWHSLSKQTQRTYRAAIKQIDAALGDIPVDQFNDPSIRDDVSFWLRTRRSKPRMHDLLKIVLSNVVRWCIEELRDPENARQPLIRENHLRNIRSRYRRADRRELFWRDSDVAKFVAVAPPYLTRAVLL